MDGVYIISVVDRMELLTILEVASHTLAISKPSDLILLGGVETIVLQVFFIVGLGWERDCLAGVGWGDLNLKVW